jgi:hypothetical protein
MREEFRACDSGPARSGLARPGKDPYYGHLLSSTSSPPAATGAGPLRHQPERSFKEPPATFKFKLAPNLNMRAAVHASL